MHIKGMKLKMKRLLSFIHPHIVPNMYDFLYFSEHKRGPNNTRHCFHYMDKNNNNIIIK